MSIYNYEQAFGAWDITSNAMRRSVERWFSMYYESTGGEQKDPCQRIAYTVVNKLVKTVFGEYSTTAETPFWSNVLHKLNEKKQEALQLAFVGGECYIKPCPEEAGFSFIAVPRNRVLIFGRDSDGVPTDIGLVETRVEGNYYYTILERRTVDAQGYLTIRNRLYRSRDARNLGGEIPLQNCAAYRHLPQEYRYEKPVGSVGLVRMKLPILNCVDGSADGVAVYAAAEGLIANIDRNEAQLNGEFDRGESRILVSADLLDKDLKLKDHLFVGLDEAPEALGLTIFSPDLREQSFLARKQEYLRNVESILGLKRGMLSDSNMEDKTATEITDSAAEFALTVIEFQRMWQRAVEETVALCSVLGQLYGIRESAPGKVSIDWGNGILYDQEKTWQAYMDLVDKGLLKPELMMGWRFGMPVDTAGELQAVRERLMP